MLFILVCSSCSRIPDADYSAEDPFMQAAIEEARNGIYSEHGGPFGAVVVKDGEIIGKGHNMVIGNNDSTAHGEITAIRDAEKKLGTYDLSGTVLYTTGEPCPMCLAACMWANIDKLYYGSTLEDNAEIGFRDEAFNEKFGGRGEFGDYLTEKDRAACNKLYEEYMTLNGQRY